MHTRIPDIGVIAPGRRADLVVFEDINCPEPCMVFSFGQLVAKNGKMLSKFLLHRRIMFQYQ
jgi:adenine deaminase